MLLLCLIPGCALAEGPLPSIGAWLPYWVMDESLDEADALGDSVDTVIAFEALFDSSDRPLMLPDTKYLLDELNDRYAGSNTRVLLSIVNDIELSEGSYVNKSPELLWRLFGDDAAMAKHITRLLQLVDTYRLSGLEIDYEALRNDTALWERFAIFIAKLYDTFSAEGLTLRVVLSYDAPKYIVLPEGPEYSVMCYNLYGYHSGPGPKADLEMLKTVAAYYAPYAQSTRMAFATGGFDWHDNSISALTQQEAEALLAQADITPTRDLASGALYSVFRLDDTEHTVWYADAETLAIWAEATAGFAGVDLFRLGGNNLDDWRACLIQ